MIFGFVNIVLQGSLFLLILLAFFFILITYFFYKYTVPAISLYKKLLLSTLRSIILLLLVFLIFEPILNIVRVISEKTKVGILIDNTQSMSVSKVSANQIERLKNFFKDKTLERQYPDIAFEYYSFAKVTTKHNQFYFDSLRFDGEVTDISSAFREFKNKNYSAIMLISDGNYNTGRNPLYDVEELNIPVFVIGVGDSTRQRDLMITKIQTNKFAYSGNKVPVEVTLRWSGFEGEKAELFFREDKKIISRTTIDIDVPEAEKRIELFYDAESPGIKKLSVYVPELKNELTEKNNFKNFYIEVLKSRLKIMLISGAPSPDVSVVFSTLSENKNYEVINFVQKNADEFYPFFKDGKFEMKFNFNVIDTIDCLVLINYPVQTSKLGVVSEILKKIQEKKIPVFIILGKDVDYTKLKYFDAILPFSWTSYNSIEMLVYPILVEKSAASFLLNKDLTVDSYKKLPPIFKLATQHRAKIESTVLANMKDNLTSINEPMFISRNINRQKTFAILAYGLWRWKLLSQGSMNEKFLLNFLTSVVDWLTITEDKQNIKVTPTKENFTTAEPIEFTAEIYNEQFQPIDGAVIKINVFSGTNNYELLMNNIGNGRYEGSLDHLKAGDYTFTAKVEMDGIIIGEDQGKFTVGDINIEYLDTRMDVQILKRIALQSGGKYFTVDSIEQVGNTLSKLKTELVENKVVSDYKLWTQEILGGIVVLLFVIEWFIRKRNGLL